MQVGKPARVALIFDESRPGTTGTYFERACEAATISWDHWDIRQLAAVPGGYDLYLRIDHGDDYELRLPRHVHPAVFYAIDTHLPRSWRRIRHTASQYDLVFCAQANAARALRAAEWLPFGCDVKLLEADDARESLDVVSIGTEGGVPRKFYLQALRERYPNSFIGQASWTRLGDLYRQGRTGFNFSIAGDVNMRIFEILGSGTCLVTNALGHRDLETLGLNEDRHVVCYRTPQQLFERIDYLLGHPEERRAIAQSGKEVVRNRHTYQHRLNQLLQVAAQRLRVAIPQASGERAACASW